MNRLRKQMVAMSRPPRVRAVLSVVNRASVQEEGRVLRDALRTSLDEVNEILSHSKFAHGHLPIAKLVLASRQAVARIEAAKQTLEEMLGG